MFQFDFHVVEEDVIEEFENHLRESIDIPLLGSYTDKFHLS